MISIRREHYLLLLSTDPCEIFKFFNVDEMHGLNIKDCQIHENNEKQAYIAGWCNYIPKPDNIYTLEDPFYVFINLTRCYNDIESIRTIFHELMHMSLNLKTYSEETEEEIISWADHETDEVYDLIRNYTIKDSIVRNVINKYAQRSELGIKKYGTTLEENNKDNYLLHLQQELMDASLYIEKLLSKLEKNGNNVKGNTGV